MIEEFTGIYFTSKKDTLLKTEEYKYKVLVALFWNCNKYFFHFFIHFEFKIQYCQKLTRNRNDRKNKITKNINLKLLSFCKKWLQGIGGSLRNYPAKKLVSKIFQGYWQKCLRSLTGPSELRLKNSLNFCVKKLVY